MQEQIDAGGDRRYNGGQRCSSLCLLKGQSSPSRYGLQIYISHDGSTTPRYFLSLPRFLVCPTLSFFTSCKRSNCQFSFSNHLNFQLLLAPRMSIGSAILSLEALARKAEYTVEAFESLNISAIVTKEQHNALESSSMRIWESAAKIADKIDDLKQNSIDWTLGEGKKLAAQAVSAREDIIARGRPRGPAAFRRNFVQFFDGPKDSPIDSSATRSRNKLTRARCELIRCLSPHAIISWAAAFPSSIWAAGFMPDHAFDYLIENVEPEEIPAWPTKIGETLHAFAAEEPLQRSNSYMEFLQGLVSSTSIGTVLVLTDKQLLIVAHHPSTTIKESQYGQTGVNTNHLSQYGRHLLTMFTIEIQYMFSKAPINLIQLLGDLLSNAVRSSYHWKMERSLGEPTTDCLTTMIPEDTTQDSAITLWIGPETRYHVIKALNLQPTWSS